MQCIAARRIGPGRGAGGHAGVELVAQLEQQPLRGLAADAGNLDQPRGIFARDRVVQLVDRESRQHRQRGARSDAADLQELAKRDALGLAGKAIEQMRILTHQQMGMQRDLGAGAKITLHTHLLVREDAHLLYGFASESERVAFRQLLKISGIGARTALAVLSGLTVDELYNAVAGEDAARLVKIPGIGRKTAERLLLELRDKLDAGVAASATARPDSTRGDALHALIALGYSDKEAKAALTRLDAELPVPEAIRQALKLLSKVA